MNSEETVTPSNSLCQTAAKIFQPCVGFVSNFTFGHPIHPLEPTAPQFSEYLMLNHHRRLRIIHIKPNTVLKDERVISTNLEGRKRISRSSLSEEYWFTRWNRPLKLGNCNCSFRRSQRFSALSDQCLPLSVYLPTNTISGSIRMSNIRNSNLSNYDVPPIKIVNVETFVERLIQETLFEAFQEYFMKESIKRESLSCNVTSGVTNLGFDNGEDELDGVVLRHPFKMLSVHDDSKLEHQKEHPHSYNFYKQPADSIKKSCTHGNSGQTKKKPVVMLLHGIGSSADIWWNIINTLIYKGYEVVAPDMLGHGYSSVPDKASAYKFKNLLKYTLTVFDHYVGCDESKNSIVIGHSYGCSLATALCRYRSQQIIQLILISGGGPTPLAPPVQSEEVSLLSCLQALLKPLLFCGVKRTIFYALRGKHFDVCSENSAVPNHILQYIANGQSWPEGDAAFHRRILIPTLLVHGLQDSHITLVQECEMERTIPRAFLELIPNAGHMCMLETPEHLSHMIMCFIHWWSR